MQNFPPPPENPSVVVQAEAKKSSEQQNRRDQRETEAEQRYIETALKLVENSYFLLMAKLGLIQEMLKRGEGQQAMDEKNSATEVAKEGFEIAGRINSPYYQRDIDFQLTQIYSQFPEDNEIGLLTAEKAYRISFGIVFDQLKRQIVNKEDDRKMEEILEYLVAYLKKVIKERENAGLTSEPFKTKLGVYEKIQRNNKARK